jgi:hypothetical protein
LNHIEYQPLGVVGVISPWDYPVNLSLMPVVTAIVAGNRVISSDFEHQAALPPEQRHIYYRLREQDVADDLPKHRFFARSQLAIAAMIGRILRRG